MSKRSHASTFITVVMLLLSAPAHAGDITVIKAGSLFDSKSGRVTRNAVVVIEDDRIVAVGRGDTQIPEGATVIDLSSSFVLPGVMDMHTHGGIGPEPRHNRRAL